MITWVNLFENPLLIHFQIDRKLIFDPASLVRTGSKLSFRANWKRIKIRFSNKLSHLIINFVEEIGWIKIKLACICFTWLTSFTYFTGSKFGPPRRTSQHVNSRLGSPEGQRFSLFILWFYKGFFPLHTLLMVYIHIWFETFIKLIIQHLWNPTCTLTVWDRKPFYISRPSDQSIFEIRDKRLY